MQGSLDDFLNVSSWFQQMWPIDMERANNVLFLAHWWNNHLQRENNTMPNFKESKLNSIVKPEDNSRRKLDK